MLTFGTGVGGGIISEGRLLRGRGNAGEIGHMLTSNDREIEGDSGKKVVSNHQLLHLYGQKSVRN